MGVTATAPLFAAVRNIVGVVALPPVVLLLVALAGAVLAWRGRRAGGAVAVLGIAATLLLATPMASGLLLASLEGAAPAVLRPRRAPSSSSARRPGTARTGRTSAR